MEDNIIELSPNKAFSIQNIVKLDGRLSAYPQNEKGFVPEETEIVNGDVIIGKVSPIQPDATGP